jgi:ribosomal protein S18 acetylase RimI-like enzyme
MEIMTSAARPAPDPPPAEAGAGGIRPASPDDAGQIAVVHVRSWQATYRGLVPQDYLDGLDPADRVARWRGVVQDLDWPRDGVYVAERDGTVCGFVSLGATRDPDGDPGQTGEISAIYLLPEFWGHGLGGAMMASALGSLAAAGYQQATLWVLDSNERARRFYARGGWADDGAVKRDDSWGFPLHEVRYRRPLP